MSEPHQRTRPNFLVTGTPGVGKTTFADMIAQKFGYLHVPISQLIKDKHLWSETDEQRDCTIYDEDKLDEALDEILEQNQDGGIVFDFHCPDVVKVEDVDYVLVLRTTSDILYQRLKGRGYTPKKCKENTECEIFRVILDEVLEDFDTFEMDKQIFEIMSDVVENLDEALENVSQLIEEFHCE